MNNDPHHHCHALNCTTSVPPRLHMCAKHWRMVPKALQDDPWANALELLQRERG